MKDWAEIAIEKACRRAEEWYRSLPPFVPRVNLHTVVGHKYPAIMSEHLNENEMKRGQRGMPFG
jgi:hypothetical protein